MIPFELGIIITCLEAKKHWGQIWPHFSTPCIVRGFGSRKVKKSHAAEVATLPEDNNEYSLSATNVNKDIKKCCPDELEESCSSVLNKDNSVVIEGDLLLILIREYF